MTMKAAPLSKKKEKSLCLLIVSCVIDVAVRRELVIDECVGAARRRSQAHA